jgi:hypothetical protein
MPRLFLTSENRSGQGDREMLWHYWVELSFENGNSVAKDV